MDRNPKVLIELYEVSLKIENLANFSKYEEVKMGTITKEWKGSAAIADTNERLFWKDEQLGELVNITSTGRQNSLRLEF